MTLRETINQDVKNAMKAKEVKKRDAEVNAMLIEAENKYELACDKMREKVYES